MANKSLKQDMVMREGVYCSDFYVDGKRIRKSLGRDTAVAAERLERLKIEHGKYHGVVKIPLDNINAITLIEEDGVTFLNIETR